MQGNVEGQRASLVDRDNGYVWSANGEVADFVYGDFEWKASFGQADFGQASFVAILVIVAFVAVVPDGQDDRISIRQVQMKRFKVGNVEC